MFLVSPSYVRLFVRSFVCSLVLDGFSLDSLFLRGNCDFVFFWIFLLWRKPGWTKRCACTSSCFFSWLMDSIGGIRLRGFERIRGGGFHSAWQWVRDGMVDDGRWMVVCLRRPMPKQVPPFFPPFSPSLFSLLFPSSRPVLLPTSYFLLRTSTRNC